MLHRVKAKTTMNRLLIAVLLLASSLGVGIAAATPAAAAPGTLGDANCFITPSWPFAAPMNGVHGEAAVHCDKVIYNGSMLVCIQVKMMLWIPKECVPTRVAAGHNFGPTEVFAYGCDPRLTYRVSVTITLMYHDQPAGTSVAGVPRQLPCVLGLLSPRK